ncbi:MAG: phosphoribosylanthranilate isomerase [Geminicoccaceae bacterium]|nr:phosphoribosylanthranilate isomerase [Geminicoccaceae bacterium]
MVDDDELGHGARSLGGNRATGCPASDRRARPGWQSCARRPVRARLKICCIGDADELRRAVAAGADAVGLVGPMPSGPGPIPLELAAELARLCPPAVTSVLLSSARSAEGLAREVETVRPAALQIVDRVGEPVRRALRQAFPWLRLVQVVHVEGPGAVEEARAAAPTADALLLDSGRPGAAVPELGGTGRTHDWAVARAIVEAVARPVFLAGGLTPETIGRAIRTVRPFGVDVCSGVRRAGRLDPERLAAMAAAVAAA